MMARIKHLDLFAYILPRHRVIVLFFAQKDVIIALYFGSCNLL
jgi:hypothetical protein